MARQFRRRKFCRFTADGISEIDYKDLSMSVSPGKLSRVALPVPKPSINASWQQLSNGRVSWPCCLTPIITKHPGELTWILSCLKKYRTWVTWETW
jgi:hypothetical protein